MEDVLEVVPYCLVSKLEEDDLDIPKNVAPSPVTLPLTNAAVPRLLVITLLLDQVIRFWSDPLTA